MKFNNSIELPRGKSKPLLIVSRNVVIPLLTLAFIAIPLSIYITSPSLLRSSESFTSSPSPPPPATNDISTSPSPSPAIDTNGSTILFQDNHRSPPPLPSLTPLSQKDNNLSSPPLQPPVISSNGSTIPFQKRSLENDTARSAQKDDSSDDSGGQLKSGCNVFKGIWVPYTGGPYYTIETNCVIDDRQNCMKFGRPDMEFLKWRWKPYECELPLFEPVRFLELVRGKTMAFLGDSVGRNQMQSLVCMLSNAAQPVDVSNTYDTRFRRWHYPYHNFTIIALWSPLLLKSHEPEPNISPRVNLYLDEPDQSWSAQIEGVDIVIISAGQWFFRPFVYYQKGKPIACYKCNNNGKKMRKLYNPYFGYKMAFRTVFRTLLGKEKFRGLTFLRTFSPAHFEHGKWYEGGGCERTRPFTKQEMKLDGFNLEFYKAQVKELRAAERRGRTRGLKFRLLDTTAAMVLRPDGHPSRYGHRREENKTMADCVHWCMPGPVDTWNEFLLHMLVVERQAEGMSGEGKLLELK